MFKKMMEALKAKLDDGQGGYAWNSDAEEFYDALHKMACAEVITREQWDDVNKLIATIEDAL